MSKTTRIDAYQTVLKPGTYQSGNTRGGLNLNKWIPKFLKKIGFADTSDPLCCQYFPTVPEVLVAAHGSPTETEMTNVPVGGFFKAIQTNGIWSIYIKESASTVSGALATNN